MLSILICTDQEQRQSGLLPTKAFGAKRAASHVRYFLRCLRSQSKTRLTSILIMPGEREILVKPHIKVPDHFSWTEEFPKDVDLKKC